MYKSETAKVRELVKKYCLGNGVDLGCGGDKVVPKAVGIDLPNPYAKVGDSIIEFNGDCRDLYWFKDRVLDYVYSSHLLEDFENTEEVMREWLRVIKRGGYLVLNLPDEQVYRKITTNRNLNHKHEFFNKQYIKDCAEKIGWVDVVFETEPEDIDYTFVIVLRVR